MKSKILFESKDTGAYIEMFEFNEGTPDDDGELAYSYPVRVMSVTAKSGGRLKRFRLSHCTMGKGRAVEINSMLETAKRWLEQYIMCAKYGVRHFGCNNMAKSSSCPYLKVGDGQLAQCSVTPYSHGYSGNLRDVPASRKCDLFERMGRESAEIFQGEIPGYPLSMYEVWKCIKGVAKEELGI